MSAVEGGYVQRIDYDAIIELASARNAVVWIRREPGAFLVAGTPLALIHPPDAADEAFVTALRHACIVGPDRTLWHDPDFAVKQLVEIALRALSPGVNEPFTAITCIDRLTEGLASAATAPPPSVRLRDAAGQVRVWVANAAVLASPARRVRSNSHLRRNQIPPSIHACWRVSRSSR